MNFAPVRFCVEGLAAWNPDFDSCDVQLLPPSFRRRISKTGQKALAAAWGLNAADDARLIFSSRHGDLNRTFSLVDSMAKGLPSSPADFTLSVHHSLLSMLSIAKNNRAGHIAISGGEDSFCYGLLEAVSCLMAAPDKEVLLIHCDETLPAILQSFDKTSKKPIAMALKLSMATSGNIIEFSAQDANKQSAKTINPAIDFFEFIKNALPEAAANTDNALWKWGRHEVS